MWSPLLCLFAFRRFQQLNINVAHCLCVYRPTKQHNQQHTTYIMYMWCVVVCLFGGSGRVARATRPTKQHNQQWASEQVTRIVSNVEPVIMSFCYSSGIHISLVHGWITSRVRGCSWLHGGVYGTSILCHRSMNP